MKGFITTLLIVMSCLTAIGQTNLSLKELESLLECSDATFGDYLYKIGYDFAGESDDGNVTYNTGKVSMGYYRLIVKNSGKGILTYFSTGDAETTNLISDILQKYERIEELNKIYYIKSNYIIHTSVENYKGLELIGFTIVKIT